MVGVGRFSKVFVAAKDLAADNQGGREEDISRI